MLEAEFAGGAFLRLADRSKAEVVSLSPSILVRGWTGSFYVQRVSRASGEFLFETPAAAVVVDRDSQVRIDILENGATTVTVRWGRATVNTDVGSPAVVQAGRRIYIDPGYLPSLPQAFDRNVEDDFDAWNRERARLMAVGDKAIPSSYRVERTPIGAADLANYGEWVYVDNTPYWRPTVAVNYVPYRHGGWSYVPAYGNVWIGDYPFSYVTSHYGRWSYFSNYGWCWTYRDVWGPAWVAAVRSGPNFFWTPLDPFDRPCYIGGPYYRGSSSYAMTWDFGSLRFTLAATSYCPVTSLGYGYSYVRPVTPNIVNIINADDVNIWNIYGNNVNININNFSWVDGRLPIRQYKPQRVVRGPDRLNVGDRAIRAVERATRLESQVGRAQFASIDRTGAREIRTADRAGNRMANVRRVGVDAAREQEGIPTSRRVARAVRDTDDARTPIDRAARGGRDAERPSADGARIEPERLPRTVASRSLQGDNADALTRTTRAGADGPAVDRTGPNARNLGSDEDTNRVARTRPGLDASERSPAARTERAAPSSDDRPSRTIGSVPNRNLERTPVDRTPTDRTPQARTRETRPPVDRAPEARTPTQRTQVPQTPVDRSPRVNLPDRTREQAPSRNIQTPTREPVQRTAPPTRNIESPSRSIQAPTREPVQRTAPPTRSIESPSRNIQAPQASPRTVEPRAPQSVAPRSNPRPTTQAPTRTPPRTSSRTVDLDRGRSESAQAPSLRSPVTTPNRSTARADVPLQNRSSVQPRTAPPTINRSVTSPRTSAPAPRQSSQAPTRSIQAPTPRVQAPAPRVQAPTPRVQAPTPRIQSPSPRIQAPAPRVQAPSPRIQAPSPRIQAPSPRIQAPSPRIQAPSSRGQAPSINRSGGGRSINSGRGR